MKKTSFKIMLATLLLSSVCSFTALAGWEQSENGSWKYYSSEDGSIVTNEWKQSGNDWFFMDENGNIAVNAIIETDGNFYYTNSDGIMVTNQWVLSDDNKYYYAGPDGAFLISTTTPDGYTVDQHGVWDQSIPQHANSSQTTNAFVDIQIPEPTGYGTVKGNVTWQYNKYIGTKADVGALVYLIPLDYSIKGGNNENLSMCMNTKGANGVYYAKVDGFGQYIFDNVPCGKYRIFIISDNTTGSKRFKDEAAWEERIDALFGNILTDDELETFKTMLGFDSFYTETIEIFNGMTNTISHDFGYTYI
ncbi:hypothetical protein [Clostridium sp. chh4-2]|uniref:hypothetical protein n=1 Tax=Clostridium sp. chh4-2 TaxID=2067550 RepID=UPI0011AF3D5F|nr:hypothetical protein [Clostridium sp. chh4-2]